MATVLEKLNEILDEKKEKIIPENIKAGVKIFDIKGAAPSADLDTTDATATPDDIAEGVTAYVNSEKITGTVFTSSGTGSGPADEIQVNGSDIEVYRDVWQSEMWRRGSRQGMYISQNDLAIKLGVTDDMIVKGKTILGVEGIAEAADTGYADVSIGGQEMSINWRLTRLGWIDGFADNCKIMMTTLYCKSNVSQVSALLYNGTTEALSDGPVTFEFFREDGRSMGTCGAYFSGTEAGTISYTIGGSATADYTDAHSFTLKYTE